MKSPKNIPNFWGKKYFSKEGGGFVQKKCTYNLFLPVCNPLPVLELPPEIFILVFLLGSLPGLPGLQGGVGREISATVLFRHSRQIPFS